MSWIKKILGIDKKDTLVTSSLEAGGNRCQKCGGTIFSYDQYWKESCCVKCGWTVKGQKRTEPKNTKDVPAVHQPPDNYRQGKKMMIPSLVTVGFHFLKNARKHIISDIY